MEKALSAHVPYMPDQEPLSVMGTAPGGLRTRQCLTHLKHINFVPIGQNSGFKFALGRNLNSKFQTERLCQSFRPMFLSWQQLPPHPRFAFIEFQLDISEIGSSGGTDSVLSLCLLQRIDLYGDEDFLLLSSTYPGSVFRNEIETV